MFAATSLNVETGGLVGHNILSKHIYYNEIYRRNPSNIGEDSSIKII